MKKKILMTGLMLTLSLAACGKTETPSSSEVETETVTESEIVTESETEAPAITESVTESIESISTESKSNELDVSITIPSDYLFGAGEDDIKAGASEIGVSDVTVNTDGSAVYKMSRELQIEVIDIYKNYIENYMSETPDSDDYPFIKKITADEGYTEYTVTIDKSIYDPSIDVLFSLGLSLPGYYYQLFSGVNEADLKMIIYLVDAETGAIFDTLN